MSRILLGCSGSSGCSNCHCATSNAYTSQSLSSSSIMRCKLLLGFQEEASKLWGLRLQSSKWSSVLHHAGRIPGGRYGRSLLFVQVPASQPWGVSVSGVALLQPPPRPAAPVSPLEAPPPPRPARPPPLPPPPSSTRPPPLQAPVHPCLEQPLQGGSITFPSGFRNGEFHWFGRAGGDLIVMHTALQAVRV